MKYYGDIDPRMLFAKDDPARLIFEMAFGSLSNDPRYKAIEHQYTIPQKPFEERMQWEGYVSTIPYTEFKEVEK